jgi:hypothetical protein
METHEALFDLVTKNTNTQIAQATGVNYYTVATWRWKFKQNQLSVEKQIEILTRTNYKLKSLLLWKQEAK